MSEQGFDKYRGRILETLKFATENSHSDFYNKKYKVLKLKTEEVVSYADFQKIPFLTKDVLLQTPLDKRIFVPATDIDYYTSSSGTSGKNIPLVLPRGKESTISFSDNDNLRNRKLHRLLLLLPLSISANNARRLTIPYIIGDPNKLPLTAQIIREAKIDSIFTTATLLYLFIEQLKTYEIDTQGIRYIKLGAEACTAQKVLYFKDFFPNAYFDFSYGASEIGRIGYRCEYMSKEKPNIFHLQDNNFIEIINVDEDGFGELVFTSLEPSAFPLIRYKSGDLAKRLLHKCSCGATNTIELRGRSDGEQLRISGVLLHSQAIANAIEHTNGALTPYFQAHVYERTQGQRIYTEIVLDLEAQKTVKKPDKKELTRIVENNLYLSSDKTMNYFINEGLFLPLRINLVGKVPQNSKTKNIIFHSE